MRLQYSKVAAGIIAAVVGQPFDVPLIPADIGEQKLGSIRLRITWDPAQFDLVRESSQTAGWKTVVNRHDAHEGDIVVGGYSLHGIGGNAAFHTLTFKPLVPMTEAPIAVEVVECNTELAQRIEVAVDPLVVTATEGS